jgi:hypothetical protein
MAIQAYGTMAQGVEGLRQRGFTADFIISKESGRMTAGEQSFDSSELTIVEHHRFEGMSDPDDASVLYALEGPNGLKGLLVDAYGTYANPQIGAALKQIKDRHAGTEDAA